MTIEKENVYEISILQDTHMMKIHFIANVNARLEKKWQSIADADLIKTREECMYGFVVEIDYMMQNALKKGLTHLKRLFVFASNRGLLFLE